MALLCVRYVSISAYDCLALEPGVGLQIVTAQNAGPVWATGISINLWYTLALSLDATGLLTASLDGNILGTFRPTTPIDSGSVAVATESAEAAFDDIVVTKP
jgi:hypothetical protein